jgi:hypothetical protein
MLARAGSSWRSTADAVLLSYASLGREAPAWLAKQVADGVPSDPRRAFQVLDTSLPIARKGVATLRQWMASSASDAVMRIRCARLLLELNPDDEDAGSVYRAALLSARPDDVTQAMLALPFLGRSARRFAADLLTAVERPANGAWRANVVETLDTYGPISEPLRGRLERLRQNAGMLPSPVPNIDTGPR